MKKITMLSSDEIREAIAGWWGVPVDDVELLTDETGGQRTAWIPGHPSGPIAPSANRALKHALVKAETDRDRFFAQKQSVGAAYGKERARRQELEAEMASLVERYARKWLRKPCPACGVPHLVRDAMIDRRQRGESFASLSRNFRISEDVARTAIACTADRPTHREPYPSPEEQAHGEVVAAQVDGAKGEKPVVVGATVFVALGDQDVSPILKVCPDIRIVRIPREPGDESPVTLEELQDAMNEECRGCGDPLKPGYGCCDYEADQ